jgi:two-component sensor histidine kinase
MPGDPIANSSLRNDPSGSMAVPTTLAGDCGRCLIVAEADHRIANHLAMLASYVRMKAADLSSRGVQPDALDVLLLLEGIGVQIDTLSHVHRSLSAGETSPPSDIGDHLRAICAPMLSVLTGSVEFTEDFAPGCAVPPDDVLPLTQIAAEVLTNAIKHARSPGKTTRLFVGCRMDEAGAFQLEVRDNGPGFPPAFDPLTGGGLGFRLLRALSRRIGASIAFESSQDGLCFRLSLPPAA